MTAPRKSDLAADTQKPNLNPFGGGSSAFFASIWPKGLFASCLLRILNIFPILVCVSSGLVRPYSEGGPYSCFRKKKESHHKAWSWRSWQLLSVRDSSSPTALLKGQATTTAATIGPTVVGGGMVWPMPDYLRGQGLQPDFHWSPRLVNSTECVRPRFGPKLGRLQAESPQNLG